MRLLFSVLKIITSHPLAKHDKWKAVMRFVKWQVGSRLNPYPIIYPFTKQSKLVIQRGMTGATGNLYCGLHEFNDMAFVLHLLRKQDRFADVGANIGSYTVLASAHCEAITDCFEPVPATFMHLKRNIAINQMGDRVTAHNIAVGSAKGAVDFTSTSDTTNHVAQKGDTNTIRVPVETLDSMLQHQPAPLLLKIDVEGFETEVINGAAATLLRPELKAIIMEIKGSGARYGYDEQQLNDKLVAAGFKPYQYDGMQRRLLLLDTYHGAHNTIYLRDVNFIEDRIATAPFTRILSFNI